jgi:hypothetical protein
MRLRCRDCTPLEVIIAVTAAMTIAAIIAYLVMPG